MSDPGRFARKREKIRSLAGAAAKRLADAVERKDEEPGGSGADPESRKRTSEQRSRMDAPDAGVRGGNETIEKDTSTARNPEAEADGGSLHP